MNIYVALFSEVTQWCNYEAKASELVGNLEDVNSSVSKKLIKYNSEMSCIYNIYIYICLTLWRLRILSVSKRLIKYGSKINCIYNIDMFNPLDILLRNTIVIC